MSDQLRIGSPNSIIKPGDAIPGKPGSYYRAGMYAPKPETLSSQKLQEMDEAGLLPSSELDIYDEDGAIDEQKLASFDYLKALAKYGIEGYNREAPPFALIGFLTSVEHLDLELFSYFKLKYLDWVADLKSAVAGDLSTQAAQYQKNTDTEGRNLITGYGKQGKEYIFVIYQPFFVYLSVPIVPGIQGISTGLNASTLSVHKTLGYILFDRMKALDSQYFLDYLRASGWNKFNFIPKDERLHYARAGEEVGINKQTLWFRDTRKLPLMVSSVLSPRENFSDAFVCYYLHRDFFKKKSPELFELFERFINYIKDNYNG